MRSMPAVCAVAVLAAACSSPGASPRDSAATVSTAAGHPLSGTISVPGFDPTGLGTGLYSGPAGTCIAKTGYDDVQAGGQVTIRDGAGTVIGLAPLQRAPVTSPDMHLEGRCRFPFSATVPDADFYQISVGHRNALTYSRDELAAESWTLSLSLS